MKTEYKCICGKVFKSQQALFGHKASCKEYYLQRDGNLDNYYKRIENHTNSAKLSSSKISKSLKEKNKKEKIDKFEIWVSEEHRCEYCGKIMTEFYGSGRFCSKSCANSRKHLEKTKEKISNSIKTSELFLMSINSQSKTKLNKYIQIYDKNPKYCIYCNSKLPYELRKRKTCSDKCLHEYLSKISTGRPGHDTKSLHHNKFHKGWYKGIFCDSTYELVYVIYNLDHNIPFKRCTRVYKYEYNNKIHNYHPDFELEDGTLIEIKGYITDNLNAKILSVKDRPIEVLYKDDLEYAFNYVQTNYTYNKLKDLYD